MELQHGCAFCERRLLCDGSGRVQPGNKRLHFPNHEFMEPHANAHVVPFMDRHNIILKLWNHHALCGRPLPGNVLHILHSCSELWYLHLGNYRNRNSWLHVNKLGESVIYDDVCPRHHWLDNS